MRLALAVCLGWALTVPAGAQDGRTASKSVDFAIVVTGGELLAGVYPDGHTQFLARTLLPLGLRCVGSVSVDDRPADIQDALRFALRKASLVIVTGGLGPTDNDLTRETLAEFTGVPLHSNADVLHGVMRRRHAPTDQLPENLRRQALVPSQGSYLKNSNGTAVGIVFEQEDTTIVALPGPPSELRPMVLEQLVPYLSRKYGTRTTGCALTLRFVGLRQSQVDQTLEDKVKLPDEAMISSAFDGGRVDFTFALPEDSPRARARLRTLKEDVLEHLGDHVYADDASISLEERVIQLLREQHATLAIVEAGTAGVLSAGLVGADPHGDVVVGVFLASTQRQLQRLVDVADDRWSACKSNIARTELLASAAQARAGSQWVLAVGASRREPDGHAKVPVAFGNATGALETQQIPWRGTELEARGRLATQLVDQLRRRLQRAANDDSASGT
jgi:nicotinamide-nucleotide amidase